MDIKDYFLRDVASHTMEVVRVDGVHRHLRFRRGGESYINGFDVITWPGTLCIQGDCGTYVFSRLTDMFQFFRSPDGRINPSYWQEKVEAQDRTGGIKEWDERSFRQNVVQRFRDWWRESYEFGARRKCWQELRTQVLECSESEYEAMPAAYAFEFSDDGISPTFRLEDAYELAGERYTRRFLWNCHAIVWAIQQFDASNYSNEAA
ncbi:hypothetical protein L2Y96_18200 [Luteibacter aegosomaticola]|uniref:hypothetical protein n=1 Tax=Luteibacter aegosomaticola TaxID=2911538 RepID=UPI001FFBE2B1|nr:hypothetical protein [Luteibacter aegosomaticola]UPG89311.1 hypothetical protein L2Y96_18200 [Luteibacter aegosomaticola]